MLTITGSGWVVYGPLVAIRFSEADHRLDILLLVAMHET